MPRLLVRISQEKQRAQAGFTLVELAITLTIIGLIVGGVLTGQHLIRSAELRQVTAKLDFYSQAIISYRSKFFALPGDHARASNLWGAEPAAKCPGNAGTPSTGVATCDGDEDGRVTSAPGAGLGNETFRAWQHLVNADFIDGPFTGVQGALGPNHAVAGENVPGLKISSALLHFQYLDGNNGDDFGGEYGNVLLLGASNAVSGAVDVPVFRVDDLLNIDEKRDDGLPASGNIRSRNASKHPNCATSDNAIAAVYDALQNGTNCEMVYLTGF